MSGLPDQEHQTSYTQDDVQHIVAREMAKQQLVQLQNGQLEINKRLVEIVGEFKAELKGIKDMLDKTPEEVQECKSELKKEIKEAHPNHTDLKEIESQIDKYKNIGYGLVVGGGIIFMLAQYIIVTTLEGVRKSIDEVGSANKQSMLTLDKVNRRVDDLESMIISLQNRK